MPGNDIHGGFASHVRVLPRGLCAVDEQRLAEAGLQLADVSVVADAVTTPYQAAVQAEIKPGDLAIVVGFGGAGGYAVQIARALGATVVALDVDQTKLDTMTGYGAALTHNVRELPARELKKAIQGFVKENGLPQTGWKVFECSGTAAGQNTAFGLLTFGATLFGRMGLPRTFPKGFSEHRGSLGLDKIQSRSVYLHDDSPGVSKPMN